MQATPDRTRNPLLATLVILVVGISLFMLFSSIWTEKLWFDNVGYTQVFLTQLVVKVGLFALGFTIMGVSVWLNMMIAYNSKPATRRTGASAVSTVTATCSRATSCSRCFFPRVFWAS